MTCAPNLPVLLCVRLTGPEAALRELLLRHPTEARLKQRGKDGATVEVLVDERTIAAAGALGLAVEVVYDASERSAERHKLVGTGNRFADGKCIPQGLGVLVAKADPPR